MRLRTQTAHAQNPTRDSRGGSPAALESNRLARSRPRRRRIVRHSRLLRRLLQRLIYRPPPSPPVLSPCPQLPPRWHAGTPSREAAKPTLALAPTSTLQHPRDSSQAANRPRFRVRVEPPRSG